MMKFRLKKKGKKRRKLKREKEDIVQKSVRSITQPVLPIVKYGRKVGGKMKLF